MYGLEIRPAGSEPEVIYLGSIMGINSELSRLRALILRQ